MHSYSVNLVATLDFSSFLHTSAAIPVVKVVNTCNDIRGCNSYHCLHRKCNKLTIYIARSLGSRERSGLVRYDAWDHTFTVFIPSL